jgi:gliding motility-associated-like protein
LKLVLSSEVINVGGTFVAAILPTGYVNSSPLTRALPTTTSADMGGYDWGVYTSATLSPGAILAPGNLCGPGIPAAIVPTSNATGGSLTATRYKYQWEVSTTSASSGFANISAADTLTSYTPTAPISVTTYYRRGVVTKDLSNNNVNSIVYTNVATVLVQTKPTLTINPTSTTVTAGISATLSGTSTGDTFGWSPAATLSSSTTASVTATPLTSTVYTLTASFAATGCSLSATSTVLVLNPGTIGSNQNNCGSFTPATITSVADASGLSITGITYKWQSSTTSASSGFADITGATANTYSPGVTAVTTYFRRVATKDDASATSNVVTVTVHANPTLTINPASTTIASGISATLSGTSTGDTFGWSPAATLSSSTTASVSATPLTSTAYTLTASFAATGCSLSATSMVLVLNPGTIGSNQNNCGPFTPATITSVADASGLSITGITYKWQSSTTSSSSGFSDIAGATASSYTPGTTAVTTYFRRIAIKDDASATSNVVTVTINTVPTVAATNNSPICAGGVLSFTSSGGTSYSWTGPNSFTSISQNPSINSATTAASGTYSVVVTAANGCTASISTTATVNALPAVTVSPSSASINLGNSVPLVASGASNYIWSPSTGLSAANIASVTANPTVNTTYTVTGTAASSGCTNTTTVTVTVLPSLVLVPGTIGSDQTICSGATPATLTSTTNASGGTGSISYQWQQSTDNTSFTDISGANAVSYSPAALTSNTFYRRGAKTSTDAITFSNTVKITVQLSVSGTISGGGISVCGGANSGSLTLTGNTGSVVKWQSSTNGFSTATDISNTTGSLSFSNLAATTQYRAVVQQSTCAVATTEPVTVTVNPLPVTGAIAGPCALTRDSSGIFTTSAVANATRYVWALPAGWSGTSVTNSITVKAGAAAGTISVTAFNGACASLTTSSYKATIIDHAQVTITATPVVASGNLSSTMLVKIQLFDVEGKPVTCSGGIATLCSNIPSAIFSTVADNNDGTYSSFLSSPANNIKICGTVGGIPLSKTTNVTFTGPQGGIKGNGPILETEIPKLTFTFTSGVGPFTVIYRSAKSTRNDTLTNVVSGRAIPVASIPSTTLYTLLSIIDNGTGERRNDNFNRDTATVIVVGPRIIVTLHADPAKYERDSLWSTKLTLHVKNIGELDLSNVQVKLNLKDVFPSPVTYVLDSVVVNGTTVVKNSSYDGVQNSDLFARLNKPAPAWQATSSYIVTAQASPGVDGEDSPAPASSNADHEASADADEHSVYMFGALSQLPVGVEGTMFLYIHLKPNGYYEPFVMQAVALGTGHTEEGAALATSLSNDNNDVNSHPELTKKGDPLPTVVNLIPNPVVGVSLAAGTPVDKGNGTYDVPLSYSVRNYGNVNLQSLRIFQNLARMIGAPSTFTIVGAVSTTGTLVPNPAFDGNLDSNLLLTTSELQFAQSGTIQYTINIKPNQLSALYRLQAMASAFNTDISGTVTDLSTDGNNPDPDGDKIPVEKVLTLIVINMPIPPLVPGNIGIDTLPPSRLTTLTKTYCNSASGVAVVSTSATTGGSGPYEWQWQSSVDNSTFINIGGATDSILTNANFTTSTYLRRRVISDNQVAYSNSVYIQISTITKPVVSPSGPLTLPFNGTVTLASSAAAPLYSWSTGAATQSITTGLPGAYVVTVKNSAGCSATSDPVAVKPPPPKTVDSTYIVGALSNPANSGVQVTAMNGATLNYYLVAANGTLVAVPALPALTGDFVYYVSETLNGVESDRVQYKVKMLDLPADIEKLLTKAPTLQADGGFLMSFNFRAANKRNELLDSVRIKDDLSKVFPAGSSWEIASLQATGKLVANSQFNGSTQTDLLAAGSQLPGLQKDSVQLSLKVYPKGFSGTLNNSAELTAKSPYGVFRVISNDPTVGNGIAVRNPTKFFIPLVDIFIPSGFSPNHDGMNDAFVISHPFNMEINLEVYNRWGNLVFKSPDYKNEFDGRGNQPNNILGAELPDGTYYYIVLATDKTTSSVKKFAGFITLKR